MTTPRGNKTEEVGASHESVPPFGQLAKVFFIGIFMGSADAVPGVSGGTVALITGIYERLIGAITSITLTRLVQCLRSVTPLNGGISLERTAEILEEIDACFLTVLVAGIGTAVVLVGQVVEYAETHSPVLLFGFFFGLIASSAVVLLREITLRTVPHRLAALAGFLVAFILSGEVRFLEGGGLVIVFVVGAIAVSAMILPGISGSLLLVIFGQYTRMYAVLGDFISGLVRLTTGGAIETVVEPGRVVLTFLIGGLVGLFTVARLIRRMLTTNRETTMAFLVALVVGALRAPITELSGREGFSWTTATTANFASVAVVGAVLVFVLIWAAGDFDLDVK